MTIFSNGSQGLIDISAYSLSKKLLLTGLASFVVPMVSTNVTTASDQSMDGWFLRGLLPDYGVDDAGDGFFAAANTDTDAEHATTTTNDELDGWPTGMWCSKDDDDLPTGVPFIKNGKSMTTIVDKSGVHTHIIKYCMCTDAPSADLQLFRLGLFPASFTQPKTTFTFDVLDDFLLDNFECGTSAMNYYSKLRRMTTNVFPHLVPDRYQELMRVARQWQQLKLLKWNGFGHKEKDVKPGDLTLFCPACPQLGINVTLPTEDGPAEINSASDLEMPSWLYSRSLVMDGNFKAEHMHAANPIDEVPLMDGRGFMVGDGKYKAHLALAKDATQRSKCNNHHTVNQANASRHRLEATSIGSCACTRHGCFVLHAMVDFQKGERQMNMDYALCEALKHNAGGIWCALTFYDVNCQYHKYLKDRVADSPYLQIQEQLEIILGIGLWHVHGHQDSCYVHYASNFITGAARIDGEIMETLWVPLNIISPLAQGMGMPHRKECLDYQMNNCNFMKMIRMSKALCQKFRQAVKGLADSREAFQKLDQSAKENNVRDWGEQERLAQERHSTDPTAMDIYEVQLQKAPTRKEQELRLLEENGQQPAPACRRGAVTWLAEGLSIKEAQIGRRRERLQGDIDHWSATVATFISNGFGDAGLHMMEHELLILQEDSDDEMTDEFRLFEPEKVVIPLPSNLGQGRCTELSTADVMHQECVLQEGQANDALHNIRVHLADKAVIFRQTVRMAKLQAKSTRAWAPDPFSGQGGKHQHKHLFQEHLKVSTAVTDPNARGQRNSMLAWFWSMNVEGDSDSSDWLNEFYRVHWLRAKALRDHWEEEMLLVQHEMNWTCNFFLHKAEQWIHLASISKAANKVGHLAYVAWQRKMYQGLYVDSRDAFEVAKGAQNPMSIMPAVL
ncbi:hypothetical protein EDB19DRAFT_1966658 [Suillus lakei]|nr:hypothetical protein EDB19DRAFT_1966658 [Suillus lakei]